MNKLFLYFVFCTLYSGVAKAEFIVPVLPTSPIYDEVGLLAEFEKNTLEQKILTLEQETHHQIAVAIIKSLQERTIEEVGITIARSWGIGQKNLDNGLLILIAPKEREMRLEVGRGLEGVVTDLISKRIIDENLSPNFKKDQYTQGLTEAIERITPLLRGEVVTLPEQPKNIESLVTLIIWLVWGGFFLGSALFEPSKAWWPGMTFGGVLGGLVMWFLAESIFMIVIGIFISGVLLGGIDFLFSKGFFKSIHSRPHGGRWGGGGFGNGGGGWGSFGGGGFGGGGASGRW